MWTIDGLSSRTVRQVLMRCTVGVALAVMVGCSSGNDDNTTRQGDTTVGGVTTDSAVGGSSGTVTSPSSTGGDQTGDSGFDWIRVGTNDPGSPTPTWPFYDQMAKSPTVGSCLLTSDARASSPVSDAMVALCQAAVEGNMAKWDEARRGLSAEASGCIDEAVMDLLRRALAWHDSNPGKRPSVKVPPAADYSDCGTPTLDELFLFESDQQTLPVGTTLQLRAYSNVKAGSGQAQVKATWTSSAPTIASVNADGLVTMLQASKTPVIITAHAKSPRGQEVTAAVTITVTGEETGSPESSTPTTDPRTPTTSITVTTTPSIPATTSPR